MSQLILFLAATALLAIASSQFASASLATCRIALRARQRRFHTLKNLRNAAEIARLDSELQALSSKSSTLDWRIMEVAEVVAESADCRSFYLVDPYQQPLPDFRPGQYLMVRPAIAGEFQTTRCYSLSSSPDSRYWRITVKRLDSQATDTRSTSGGLSSWLHENIQAGDCLLIGGPSGHFCLPADNTDPLVLIAAGVGVTPMASMLRWSLENTPNRPLVLLYQAQDVDHWPLGKHMHSWLTEFPKCRIISYFSRQSSQDLQKQLVGLPGEWRSGKLTVADAVQALEYDNCNYFFCGPETWMSGLREGLAGAGVPPHRMHWESFGGEGNRKEQKLARTNAVTRAMLSFFERSQVRTTWSDPEQTLWELARENDISIPSGCLSGVCGSCKVPLVSWRGRL